MDYSDPKSFNTMQEEAIRRVREMQRRSRSVQGFMQSGGQAVNEDTSQRGNDPSAETNARQTKPSSGLGSLLNGIGGKGGDGELFNIAGISVDEEKALIGLLIYILYKQGADVKLLLALGYLLL